MVFEEVELFLRPNGHNENAKENVNAQDQQKKSTFFMVWKFAYFPLFLHCQSNFSRKKNI